MLSDVPVPNERAADGQDQPLPCSLQWDTAGAPRPPARTQLPLAP